MPVLIGLLLAPLGALLGSVLFFLVLFLVPDSGKVHGIEWLQIALFGAAIGMVAAVPTSALALPAAYGALRRRGILTSRTLASAGAIAGFVIVAAIMFAVWGRGQAIDDWLAQLIVFCFAADGAIAGALCGWLLARIMRRLRPDDVKAGQARQA